MRIRTSVTTVVTYCVLAVAGAVPILMPTQLVSPVARAAGPADLIISSAQLYSVLEAADAHPGNGCLDVPGNLIIKNGGSILANDDVGGGKGKGKGKVPNSSADPICIQVGGNMEMEPSGSIFAENRAGGGNGGLISITVAGDLSLRGNAGGGATISSSKTAGAGDTGVGGDLTIQVTGVLVTEPNTKIYARARGFAGDIHLSGASVRIDGAVSAMGDTTLGLGGQIFIIAGGDLTLGDGALVQSRGQDPGADLVHLQGCNVVINGLVESTGPGHWAGAPNHVKPPYRAGKPADSSGGIEVWAGGTLTIDSTAPHHGELNCDIGTSGGSNGRGWVDLFTIGNINIIGDSAGAFAVHANLILGNGIGGVVTVKSSTGSITASGHALEANDGAAGGAGGVMSLEAEKDITFNSALVRARGSLSGGGGQAGGQISVRSYHGGILGTADSVLDAVGGPHKGVGSVTRQACSAITYAGANLPSATTKGASCSDTLTLPVSVPSCGSTAVPTPHDVYD